MSNTNRIDLHFRENINLADTLMFFVFHYFRYILVITQIVVVSVFFFRFTVDQGIIDGKENIAQKTAMLRVTSGIVKEAEAYATRIDIAHEKITRQDITLELFRSVAQDFGSGSSIKVFDLDGNNLKMILIISDINELDLWQKDLKKRIKQINLLQITSIQKNDINKFEVTINVSLK